MHLGCSDQLTSYDIYTTTSTQPYSQSTADYAVITGVQIHNWASDFAGGAPSLEFVAVTKMYVVVNGIKVHLDLARVPVRLRGVLY